MGRVSPLVDVITLHAAKRHEVGVGFLLKSQQVELAMNGLLLGPRVGLP